MLSVMGSHLFFDQDPVLVNETLGLYTPDSSFFDKEVNRVYQFHNKRADFGLNEINGRFGNKNFKEQIVVTAFIAPRQLTDTEREKLEKIREKDHSYYNGVTYGWSILATGRRSYNLVILSGEKSRKELSTALPNEFWEENKDIKFKYLNGEEMKNDS